MTTFKIFNVIIALAIFSGCTQTTQERVWNQTRTVDSLKIQKLSSGDISMAEPLPGEWRMMHKEPEQTFGQYFRKKHLRPTSGANTISIQRIGKFNSYQDSIIFYTAEYISIFFNLNVDVLPLLDESAVLTKNARVFFGIEQLLTADILDYLEKNIPKTSLAVMAITSKDLYPGSNFNFVFGQARSRSGVSVSSLFRYSDVELGNHNYAHPLERLIKTSAHEVCHMFGCNHCAKADCIMNGSNSLVEADKRPNRLCSSCHQKLHATLKFDVEERLHKLSTFFSKHRLERDYLLVQNDLRYLSNKKEGNRGIAFFAN